MKDLISIIVPVYNREKYIQKCLDSLIKQSYKHLEIICINDGSTDKSLEILNNYAKKDKRIKIINNPQNMGIAYSRNVGLDNATAEYIMWCDSDDWFEKNMCKKMLKTIKKHDVDLVECSAKIVFDNENLGVRKYWNRNKDWELKFSGIKELNLNTIDWVGKFLWNKIFKTSVIKKYNLKFPIIPTHEDSCFLIIYLMLSKKVYFLGEKLYNYVIHSGSAIDKVYEKSNGVTDLIYVKYISNEVHNIVKSLNIVQVNSIYNEFIYLSIFEMIKTYIGTLNAMKDAEFFSLRILRKKIDKLEEEE